MGANTVNRFETGRDARVSSVDKMRATMETAGAIFVDDNGEGAGVRMTKRVSKPAMDAEALSLFLDRFWPKHLPGLTASLGKSGRPGLIELRQDDLSVTLHWNERVIGSFTITKDDIDFDPPLLQGRPKGTRPTPNEIRTWIIETVAVRGGKKAR